MAYIKVTLSGLAAIILADLLPGFWLAFRGIGNAKATGLSAVAGGLLENVFSPLFWVLAIMFFALLLAASRLGNKPLRVFLFWVPTLAISSVGIACVALITYLLVRFRPS